MATLPSPTLVAGNQYGTYEAYYRLVDPNNTGSVGAADAAKFLKKSGLSDIVLSKIWDLSDPAKKGYLHKQGFFVALKLVSLAQSGRPTTMDNIGLDLPAPKMGDLKITPVVSNNVPPPIPPATIAPGDWAMKDTEKMKYEQLFESLQPINGRIPGNKVKGVLMESKLPLDTLGTIWDLADMDKDGMLDRHEFVVAMHLVYKALEKHSIPNVLPPELLPPAKRKPAGAGPPPVPPAPSAAALAHAVPHAAPAPAPAPVPVVHHMPPAPVLPAVQPWVVSADERAKYSLLFLQTDIDKDGFVSGAEIKDVFLQSGVPQLVLADIWNLCDTQQSGKLNSEQFALAMWLINRKLKGVDPPPALLPEMVPPGLRAAKQDTTTVSAPAATPYSNPELDMISRDIEELSREKRVLENDIADKEADIAHKSGEVKSLQSELDTLAATLRQLENQKGEAQKRLNDLKAQTETVMKELTVVSEEMEAEAEKVDKLRVQAAEQEAVLKTQEDELSSKKQELEGLRQEEARLAQQQDSFRQRLDSLTKGLQDSQLHISQAKAKISQLQEQRRQMTDAITVYDTAINTSDPSGVPDWSLHIEPEFRDTDIKKLIMVNGTSSSSENPEELTNGKDPFSNQNGPVDSKKEKKSLFDDDPSFRPTKAMNDPFASSHDPFGGSGFGSKDAFPADPFNAFGSSGASSKSDPFSGDPFGDRTGAKSPADPGKDPFGCDPFAVLHAPTAASVGGGGPPPRPESPSPALPPKKSKQPPPRPAPPRPTTGPTIRPAPSPSSSPDPRSAAEDSFGADPFGGGSGGGGGFADFANFENKFSDPLDPSFEPPRVRAPARSGSAATDPAHRYAAFEFTEDPFQNYRYEDLLNIKDPFDEDDNGNVGSAVSITGTTDAFGFSSPPPSTDKFSQQVGDDSLFGDDFTQSLNNARTDAFKSNKSKSKHVEDASNNNMRLPKSDSLTVHDGLKSSGKEKKHFWSKNTSPTDHRNSKEPTSFFGTRFARKSPTLNGAEIPTTAVSALEDQQLSWAAADSLRMEQERQRREEQEREDLARALALSKLDSSTRRRL